MSDELDVIAEYISQAGDEAARAVLYELITGLAEKVEALEAEVAILKNNRHTMPLIGSGTGTGLGNGIYSGGGNIQWYTAAANTVNTNTTYGATTTTA